MATTPILTIKFCTLTTTSNTSIDVDDPELGFKKQLLGSVEVHEERSQFTTKDSRMINLSVWQNDVTPKRIGMFLKDWGLECHKMTLNDDTTPYTTHLKTLDHNSVTRCTVLHFDDTGLQLYIIYYNTYITFMQTGVKLQETRDTNTDTNTNRRWYHEFAFLKLLLSAAQSFTTPTITVNHCIMHILKSDDCTEILTDAGTESGASPDTVGEHNAVHTSYPTGNIGLLSNLTFQLGGCVFSQIYIDKKNDHLVVVIDTHHYHIIYNKEHEYPMLQHTRDLSEQSSDITSQNLLSNDNKHFVNFAIRGKGVVDATGPRGTYHNQGHVLPEDTSSYMLFHVYRNVDNTVHFRYVKPDHNDDDYLVGIKQGLVIKNTRRKSDPMISVLVFDQKVKDGEDGDGTTWKYADDTYFNTINSGVLSNSTCATLVSHDEITTTNATVNADVSSGGALSRHRHISHHRHTQKNKHRHQQQHSRRRHRNHV